MRALRRLGSALAGLALLCNVAQATTYYVDNVAGLDANNGTSSSTPWNSLAKVNGFAFNPGDSALFLAGDTWRGTLTPTVSGSAGLPVTFGIYGSGAPPIISGAGLISTSGWSVSSGNIYVKHVGAIATPNQLYLDGTFIEPARFPANGFLSTTAISPGVTSVIDTDLPAALGANDPTGGTLVLKTSNYSARSAPITAYDGVSTLTVTTGFLDAGYPYESSTGWGFYLRGQLWMLSGAGQWFYDSAAGNLYLWTPTGDSPAAHQTIETSGQTGVVTLSGHNYITLSSLTIKYSNFYEVYCALASPCTNLVVDRVTTYGGYSSVEFQACASCKVTNSSLLNSLRYGAHVSGDGSVVGGLGNGNTIDHAGMMLQSPDTFEPAATYLLGKNTEVSYNTITNSGYSAILQAGIVGDATSGAGLINVHNTITNACMLLTDCGVDYTPRTELDQTPSGVIAYNVINHAPNSVAGTPTAFVGGLGANCFYLDVQQDNFLVSNNKCSDANVGLFSNYGSNNKVINNEFRGMRYAGMLWREVSPNTSFGNVATGNVFEVLGTYALGYADSTTDHGNIAFTDNNTYCLPNTMNAVQDKTGVFFTISAWHALTGKDTHSTQINALCPSAIPGAGGGTGGVLLLGH